MPELHLIIFFSYGTSLFIHNGKIFAEGAELIGIVVFLGSSSVVKLSYGCVVENAASDKCQIIAEGRLGKPQAVIECPVSGVCTAVGQIDL